MFRSIGTAVELIVTVKVPLSDLKALSGGRGIAVLFLELGTRKGWVVSITPQLLYPWERRGTHRAGGWVGPRAGLDVCEKSSQNLLQAGTQKWK
jgi:hypothetical protein